MPTLHVASFCSNCPSNHNNTKSFAEVLMCGTRVCGRDLRCVDTLVWIVGIVELLPADVQYHNVAYSMRAPGVPQLIWVTSSIAGVLTMFLLLIPHTSQHETALCVIGSKRIVPPDLCATITKGCA